LAGFLTNISIHNNIISRNVKNEYRSFYYRYLQQLGKYQSRIFMRYSIKSVFVDKEKFRIFRYEYHRYNGLKEIGNDEIFEGKLGEVAIPPSTFR